MVTIYGKYANAIVYTVDNELYALEDYARNQLQMICNHPSAEALFILFGVPAFSIKIPFYSFVINNSKDNSNCYTCQVEYH